MNELTHNSRAHALLSASGSERWLNCPPSARFEEQFSSIESEYAAEGTLAHELSELELKNKLGIIAKEEYEVKKREVMSNILYTFDMQEHCEVYIDHVLNSYLRHLKEDALTAIFIEEKTDFSLFVPSGFGTVDCVIASNNVLEVIDLKFGRGIEVNAYRNSQLMLYALGFMHFRVMFDFETVKLTVVQPRLNNISEYEISTTDLIEWGIDYVKPIAKQAFEGTGEMRSGKHCRFCRAKSACKCLADSNLEVAKSEFLSLDKLTDEQLIDIYSKLPVFLDWAKAIEDQVYKKAIGGKSWKGYKLVEGTTRRQWSDKEAVIKALSSELSEEEYLKIDLIGIPEVEKKLKSRFKELVGHLVTKPAGKPVLVTDTDKRPAIQLNALESAKEDFQ